MGMVVRTNMAGLNANNALNMASKTQQNAMQKLASGFRINKAADDASGLAISEKMKNQIKALDTAKDNCEDGANLIQTAEGYMNETHDILNRMTELAEKAANGVLDDTDRDALQDEMNELCGEIDRMATTANFNGHKLMDGSLGNSSKLTLTCSNDKIVYNVPKAKVVSVDGLTGTNDPKYDIDTTTLTSLKAGTYTFKKNNTALEIYSGDPTDGGVRQDDATGAAYDASSLIKAKVGDTFTADGTGAFATTSTTSNKLNFAAALSNLKANATYTFNGTDWVTNESGVEHKATGTTISPDLTKLDGKKFTISEGINLQIGESSTTADRLSVEINSFHTDTLFGGLNGFVNTTNDATNNKATSAVKIISGGADANVASTYTNGVTIDITDKDAASAAADAIRQVSNYVSDERGKLGAQQNRLEHTVNNLTTASENTTAANSRIRDTNMAEEMMNYTSKNVVAQAAQAMLAQANSQPQNVLSLLQ